MKYAFLSLLFLLSPITKAYNSTVCQAKEQDIRITKYSDGVWLQRKLDGSATQSFFLKHTENISGAMKYEVYSTTIIIDKDYMMFYQGEDTFIEEELECYSYSISDISRKESSFSKNFERTFNNKNQKVSFHKINNDTPFSIYAKDFANQIGDIGDWYTLVPTKHQSKLIDQFLEKEMPKEMKYLSKKTNIEFIGNVYSRDWYWSDIKIGRLYKKGNKIAFIVFEFQGGVLGDPVLDDVY